ncbi:hypothetical protein ACQJBY_011524 [Aegilops geniculata]
MRETVVLYAGLGAGHLAPMVELAMLFQRHGLATTIVIAESPAKSAAAAASPSINIHLLPLPTPELPSSNDPVVQMFDLLRRTNAPLRDYLRSVLPSVRALVVDIFCVDAFDVATELGVPAYLFYTWSASCLAVNLNLPHVQAKIDATGDIGGPVLSFPGNRPIKLTDLPDGTFDRNHEPFKEFLHLSERTPEFSGVLVNTFEWLEARALRVLKDGSCIPTPMPPVYPVGPMVAGCGGRGRKHECLAWLDGQPEKSVVFLCFGSRGSFTKKQLEEIAMGLERSGQRFLWVVSSPRGAAEAEPQDLLPEGFLEKADGRGFVVKSWAPQPEVLHHRATGAFVTHCGWNSTLEGIIAGLPLVCWPLYAEQRLNKVFIVEELGAGVEMAGYDHELVPAAEVESKVRLVMESPGGQALWERAMEAKQRAARATQQGGASGVAFAQFLAHLESVVRGN